MEKAFTRYKKVYVEVIALFRHNGSMDPKMLIWPGGKQYAIDRLLAMHPSRYQNSDRRCDFYKVEICGKERVLFFEHNHDTKSAFTGCWFVKAKA